MIGFELLGGRIELNADLQDAEVLTGLIEQFRSILPARQAPEAALRDPADPALTRLFPDPVPDDPAESAEVRELTAASLVEHKDENAQLVAASLAAPGPLEPRTELAWLQWLTDVRLVLAARLGILLDGDEGASATEAEQAMQQTYRALGALQADLVDLLDRRLAGEPAT